MRCLHLAVLCAFIASQTLQASPAPISGQALAETDIDASVIDKKLDDDEDTQKGESGYQFSAKKPAKEPEEDVAITDQPQ